MLNSIPTAYKSKEKSSRNYIVLMKNLLEHSESKDWEEAKTEWIFDRLYEEDEAKRCQCSHYPIINICILKNYKTNVFKEVGNCCVKKFMDNDIPNKIFNAVKVIKKDAKKDVNNETFQYLQRHNVLNNWELKFYQDTYKNKDLSPKQEYWKRKINEKIINFTKRNGGK